MPHEEDGLGLEHLEYLTFFDKHFVYQNKEYQYSDITNIIYTATNTRRSINGIPIGTTYETNLVLILNEEKRLHIIQPGSILGIGQKQRAESIMRAASIFMEVTFAQRMELYEKQLTDKKYVTWDKYQFNKNGDLFKNHELFCNLNNPDVKLLLDVFSLQVDKKAVGFGKSLAKFFTGNETIDISCDKDCFLYFMKHTLGKTWANQSVRDKRRPTKAEFNNAILVLGAKICKADGHVSFDEVAMFKSYFGIDETTHPGAGQIFKQATESSDDVEAIAKKVYELLGNNKEPLEYIVIGLIRIAAVDGNIAIEERRLIEQICRALKFPASEIDRLFLIYHSNKKRTGGASQSNALYINLRILELEDGVSLLEIKAAYWDLARKHHPDLLRAKGVPIERIKDSEDILKSINVAYEWLISNYQEPTQRKAS